MNKAFQLLEGYFWCEIHYVQCIPIKLGANNWGMVKGIFYYIQLQSNVLGQFVRHFWGGIYFAQYMSINWHNWQEFLRLIHHIQCIAVHQGILKGISGSKFTISNVIQLMVTIWLAFIGTNLLCSTLSNWLRQIVRHFQGQIPFVQFIETNWQALLKLTSLCSM